MKLGNLFNAKKGTAESFDRYHEIKNAPEGDASAVAYVSASTTNNGVNGYVVPSDAIDEVYPEGAITVAAQGDGSVAFAAIQGTSFIASKQVWILTPKADWKEALSSKKAKALLCAAIRKNHWRFSFGRPVEKHRLIDIEIPDALVAQISNGDFIGQ